MKTVKYLISIFVMTVILIGLLPVTPVTAAEPEVFYPELDSTLVYYQTTYPIGMRYSPGWYGTFRFSPPAEEILLFDDTYIPQEYDKSGKIITEGWGRCIFAMAPGSSPAGEQGGTSIRNLSVSEAASILKSYSLNDTYTPLDQDVLQIMNTDHHYIGAWAGDKLEQKFAFDGKLRTEQGQDGQWYQVTYEPEYQPGLGITVIKEKKTLLSDKQKQYADTQKNTVIHQINTKKYDPPRYYIGETADWSSVNSWSASPGGVGGASVPTIADEVILDESSFSADAQILDIDTIAYCLSFNASSIDQIAHITGINNIYIGEDFTNGTLLWNYTGYLTWQGNGDGNITSNSPYTIPAIQSESYTGTVTMQTDIDLNYRNIQWQSGTLDTNEQDILNGGEIYITTSAVKTVDITNSDIYCTSWRYSGSNLTFNKSGSEIIIGDASYEHSIIGVEWNQPLDTWRWIDSDNNTVESFDADSHAVWGRIRRCVITDDGDILYGLNARGDGLDLTGATGRVMVEIPAIYVASSQPSANVTRWWVSSELITGFELHPAWVQRGGAENSYIYISAYAAGVEYVAADNTTRTLTSQTGDQPYTGYNDCIWEVTFLNGGNEPAIGDSLETVSEGGFILVDYAVTGGTWAGGDAAGKILVRKPGDASCGWLDTENITNVTKSNVMGVQSGAVAGTQVTIGHARSLAESIGTGWGLENIWTLSAVQLLYYVEYADPDSQTVIGKGITSKSSSTGFNGEINGDDDIDTNMDANGTGTGIGSNGYTPISYRGIENLWGNVYTFVDGYEAVDASYHLVNRDGTGNFTNPLTAGNYEATTAAPITADGYVSNLLYEDAASLAFLPNDVVGLATSHLNDYWYAHNTGQTNILLAGGNWYGGTMAGVGYRYSDDEATSSYRSVGARLEYVQGSDDTGTFPFFDSGNIAYNDVTVSTDIHLANNNTIAGVLKFDAGGEQTIYFEDGTTTVVGDLQRDGLGTNIINLVSSGNWVLTKSDTTPVSLDYLNITYSTASQPAVFYAGTHSIDSGDNSNWVWDDPTITISTIGSDIKMNKEGVTSGLLHGGIIDLAGTPYITTWFEIGSSSGNYTVNTTASQQYTYADFTGNVPGDLTPGGTYYYRAAAQDGGGDIYYGAEDLIVFTLPSITTGTATSYSFGNGVRAVIQGIVNDMGAASTSTISWQYGYSESSLLYETTAQTVNATGTYTHNFQTSESVLSIYYRFVIKNGDTVVYGDTLSFTADDNSKLIVILLMFISIISFIIVLGLIGYSSYTKSVSLYGKMIFTLVCVGLLVLLSIFTAILMNLLPFAW